MLFIGELKKISIYYYVIAFLVTLGIVTNIYINVISARNLIIFIEVFIRLITVPAFAALLDLTIKKFLLKRPVGIPETAIISGLFVAGVLDPRTPLYIHFIAASLAILSKHIMTSPQP